MSDENAEQQAAHAADEAGAGDLVELHDGRHAIVLGVDPDSRQVLVVLGHPEVHELPVRRVG